MYRFFSSLPQKEPAPTVEMVLGVQEGAEKLRGMDLGVWVCEQHLELRKGA